MSLVRNLFPKKFYFAKFISQDNTSGYSTSSFATPIELNYNVQPLTGDLDFSMYGARATQMQKMIVSNIASHKEMFTRLSLAYLDGATPTGELVNGQKATHRLVDVRPYNFSLHIYFEKIKNVESGL